MYRREKKRRAIIFIAVEAHVSLLVGHAGSCSNMSQFKRSAYLPDCVQVRFPFHFLPLLRYHWPLLPVFLLMRFMWTLCPFIAPSCQAQRSRHSAPASAGYEGITINICQIICPLSYFHSKSLSLWRPSAPATLCTYICLNLARYYV